MMRPLAFGYVRATLTDSGLPRREVSARTVIEGFADREGFAVAQVFVDVAGTARLIALESLLEAMSFTVIAAIIVPDLSHLGHDRAAQQATTRRIIHGADVPVLSAAGGPPSYWMRHGMDTVGVLCSTM